MSGAAKRERRIATLTLVVADYDEAIAWFSGKLGFELQEDTTSAAAGAG
jgi:catechol 2,3-dioxygenase-like lactoylglutathione lyase family enzyme